MAQYKLPSMSSKSAHAPLAERLRPKSLGEVIGQQHLLGEGMPLRIAFESGQPHSCILWGPPGTGKTTIARLMADAFDAQFITISALHKSVRGSDPDASLYWFVRMLDGGVDPRYVARRMIRMAVEDIGLADPRALRMALDASEVYERLGSPEGELALAECLVYLAIAPKSNAVYVAYNEARALVRKDGTRPVPLHLRNAPTRLMKDLGYGKEYRYAHDEEGGFAAGETYFPEGMKVPVFYRPVERGLEIRIADKLRELRARNQERQGTNP